VSTDLNRSRRILVLLLVFLLSSRAGDLPLLVSRGELPDLIDLGHHEGQSRWDQETCASGKSVKPCVNYHMATPNHTPPETKEPFQVHMFHRKDLRYESRSSQFLVVCVYHMTKQQQGTPSNQQTSLPINRRNVQIFQSSRTMLRRIPQLVDSSSKRQPGQNRAREIEPSLESLDSTTLPSSSP